MGELVSHLSDIRTFKTVMILTVCNQYRYKQSMEPNRSTEIHTYSKVWYREYYKTLRIYWTIK